MIQSRNVSLSEPSQLATIRELEGKITGGIETRLVFPSEAADIDVLQATAAHRGPNKFIAMTYYARRRDRLRAKLRKNRIDGILITNFTNVSYLTGFSGDDSYLLVTTKRDLIISDDRFTTQLAEECPDIEHSIRSPGQKMIDRLGSEITRGKLKLIGFESHSVTVAHHDAIANTAKNCDLAPCDGWVENLRVIKDRQEIEKTRTACDQARRAFEVVRAGLTPDQTELEVAAELEYQARRFGGKCLSFPPIVATGARSALPHANPTKQKIGSADFTLIDWGVNEAQYVSDLTRILVTGKISPKLRKIYGVVLKAQMAAIDAIRPGVSCEKVDQVARTIIARAGYEKQFGHGLGHGTGLDIHEAPRLSKGQSEELKAGMIVTVEPGIYLPGWGGVRIEDDILVTKDGHEVLTSVPKELDECLVG